jgi:hypothetical protein
MTSARHKPFAMVPPPLSMSRSVGTRLAQVLEWRMFFVGEPISTSPEHALVAGSIHLT